MKTRLVSLIITDELRGSGVEANPYRRVTQLWTDRGELIAEADPCNVANSFFRPERAEIDK